MIRDRSTRDAVVDALRSQGHDVLADGEHPAATQPTHPPPDAQLAIVEWPGSQSSAERLVRELRDDSPGTLPVVLVAGCPVPGPLPPDAVSILGGPFLVASLLQYVEELSNRIAPVDSYSRRAPTS